MPLQIDAPHDEIAKFCRRWGVTEFAFFGSVLRDDFGPQSDIDVLVRLQPGSGHSIFDIVRMERELAEAFGREVDLSTWSSIEESANYVRRKAILSTAETVYAA